MVECQICYEKFKRITVGHLKNHNLNYNEYKNIFPNIELVSYESKNKTSETLKNGYITGLHSIRRGVKTIGFTGRHHTEETKKKMSEYRKNRQFTSEHKLKIALALIGKKRPDEVGIKISKANTGRLIGDKNPNWKNGKSFEPYCPKFTKNKREEIRNQYDRKCYACNKDERNNITQNGKLWKLSVHHIDFDKEQGCNGKKFILVPLCLNCHSELHHNKFELVGCD